MRLSQIIQTTKGHCPQQTVSTKKPSHFIYLFFIQMILFLIIQAIRGHCPLHSHLHFYYRTILKPPFVVNILFVDLLQLSTTIAQLSTTIVVFEKLFGLYYVQVKLFI